MNRASNGSLVDEGSIRLEFADLCGGYGDTKVLNQVSASLRSGQILGVVGRNGVGKTTLARLLTGVLPTSSGDIRLDGNRVTQKSQLQRRRLGLGYGPQDNSVFDQLTVRENLSLTGAPLSDPTLSRCFELFPRLAERLEQQAGTMSGGERKILSFVRCLIESTQIIIFDEPSEGVQPENIERMAELMRADCLAGRCFVLIEQNVSLLAQVADSAIGLDHGELVLDIRQKPVTREQLLSVLTL